MGKYELTSRKWVQRKFRTAYAEKRRTAGPAPQTYWLILSPDLPEFYGEGKTEALAWNDAKRILKHQLKKQEI